MNSHYYYDFQLLAQLSVKQFFSDFCQTFLKSGYFQTKNIKRKKEKRKKGGKKEGRKEGKGMIYNFQFLENLAFIFKYIL